MILINKIKQSYHNVLAIECLDIRLTNFKIIAVIGPNGAGKSTLLKLLGGIIPVPPHSIFINQKDICKYNPAELANIRSVMSQDFMPFLETPVYFMFNLVTAGNTNYLYSEEFKKLQKDFGISHLWDRNYMSLSGGEKQKVKFLLAIAQILSKKTNQQQYIFLDEPLNSLDIKQQIELLKLIQYIPDHFGVKFIAVFHELNHAIHTADQFLLIKQGKIIKNCLRTNLNISDLMNLFDLPGNSDVLSEVFPKKVY